MTKLLKVTSPIWDLEIGDTFTFDENTKTYTAKDESSYAESGDCGSMTFTHSAQCTISEDMAKSLIEDGFVAEFPGTKDNTKAVSANKDDKKFVNVFNVMDDLRSTYNNDLTHIDATCADCPECLKVERITVLKNLISLIDYLKTFKK